MKGGGERHIGNLGKQRLGKKVQAAPWNMPPGSLFLIHLSLGDFKRNKGGISIAFCRQLLSDLRGGAKSNDELFLVSYRVRGVWGHLCIKLAGTMSPVSSAGLNFSLLILDNTQLQAFKFLNFALIVKLTTASLFLISYIFKHMVQFKFSIFVLVAAAAAAVAPVIALPIGPGSVLLVTFLYGLTD